MTRRVVRPHFAGAEHDDVARRVEHIDRRLGLDRQAKHRPRLDGALVEKQIVPMQVDGRAEESLRGRHAGDVIDVGVGQQNVPDRQRVAPGERQQACHLVAGINEHGVPGLFTADHEAVLEEWADGLTLNYHGRR